MPEFVLVHGAWFRGSVWNNVAEALTARGHRVAHPDLPSDQIDAGAREYARTIIAAIGEPEATILVGHTTAGLAMPLIPEQQPIARIVYVNALLPEIGRSLLDQSGDKDSFGRDGDLGRRYDRDARSFWYDRDEAHRLLAADCPDALFDELFDQMRPQSRLAIREQTPLRAWPQVPSNAIVYRDDADLRPQRLAAAARERAGAQVTELPGSQYGFLGDSERFVEMLLEICELL